MAKRFVDTELWDKEWFMDLSMLGKNLVQLVRSKCDIAGIWSPNWRMVNMYLGEKVTEDFLLNIDGSRQFKKLKNGKIFCIDFVKFQYGELSEKSPVHRKILGILLENGIDFLGNEIPIKYPINRVQEEDIDKEEERAKGKDEGGKGETFPTDCPPPSDDYFDLCHELVCRVQLITIEKERVVALWPSFKAQNLTGKKYYADVGAVHSHFMNWIKDKKFEIKNAIGNNKGNGKLSPSAGRAIANRDY